MKFPGCPPKFAGGLHCWGALAVMLIAPVLHAANGTWTNTSSGGNWSAAANWSNSIVADGSGFTADFNSINITTDTTVVHLDSARTIGNLIFGDVTTNSAAGWLLDNNGDSANVLTFEGGTPAITVNPLGSSKVANISAGLAGAAGITKTGVGVLVLSGANTNTGTLAVSAGTLRLGATTVLGDGVNNAAGLVVSGSGILDLAGFSPVASPPLTFNSTANGFDVGAFYNSASTTSVFTGPITLGRQTRVGAGNVLLTGPISGGGFNFIKDGVNTLELTNSGTPSLSATQQFSINIAPVTLPTLTAPVFSNGLFQMSVAGMAGPDYTIQASTNLTTWTNLFSTNSPALPFDWSDPAATNYPRRFYRVLLGP
jgi:autotransporter-associated beta strand protein